MSAYYNEWDRNAAGWLRELIKAKLIADGEVDERSITDVHPTDLHGFTQCHFFAGIGGWSYALRLAGWPDSEPVWTGSCPCQPFSVCGLGKGKDDPRHLWPQFHRLISELRPPVVFGEQVARKAGFNWLDGVFADLEGSGYACGAADLCAAGVHSPHIRQRMYWVAEPEEQRFPARHAQLHGCARQAESYDPEVGRLGNSIHLSRPRLRPDSRPLVPEAQPSGRGDANPWSGYDLLPCADGKTRRIESGTFPLAHGVPARVVRLRGYGNAIVAPLAAQFIAAFMETSQP